MAVQQPWLQTHVLTWTPTADSGYPQQFIVMVTADPGNPGQWWALRREDWPGTTGRWEFNLATRKWFRLGSVPSIDGRRGDYAMRRLDEMLTPAGVKLLA